MSHRSLDCGLKVDVGVLREGRRTLDWSNGGSSVQEKEQREERWTELRREVQTCRHMEVWADLM
jgi:hypothetical protein